MSMYLGCDLIVDGDEDEVSRAVAILMRDSGSLSIPGAYVQCVRCDVSEPPRIWWTFEFREQHLDLVEAACAEAAATGAMVSLEWYASHRMTCGGVSWRCGDSDTDGPRRWSGSYHGLRGG